MIILPFCHARPGFDDHIRQSWRHHLRTDRSSLKVPGKSSNQSSTVSGASYRPPDTSMVAREKLWPDRGGEEEGKGRRGKRKRNSREEMEGNLFLLEPGQDEEACRTSAYTVQGPDSHPPIHPPIHPSSVHPSHPSCPSSLVYFP